jgi:hypothetical protein
MIKFLKRCPVCLNERLRPRGPGRWSCPDCGASMTLNSKGLTTRPGKGMPHAKYRAQIDKDLVKSLRGSAQRWMAPDSGSSTRAPDPACARCPATSRCSVCEVPKSWNRMEVLC